ncbi:VOC family protein [Natronorubrum texcoconense]|uniref:Glyoxalase-like domain-containing protein n=1 Tax=Natronorubrum texcoconense TaxID=1095776 RepID=A0A1G9CZF0_9EURY|nr:VOC family protein [Natronorubrum texcoconense]SDK57012.1 Glyoxalase-like domain-containing protein [Natronorubrum texcoconense]
MSRPIDHVVFAADDLDSLEESFASAGFETAYGGTHSNGITHMHLIGFGNLSYVELISKNDPDGTAPWWNDQIDTNAGASAWSVTVDDIDEESDRLADEGFEIEGPTKFSRERPDGTSVEWELAIVGGRPQGTPIPMLEMDHTPLEWRVEVTTDPETSGLMGLTEVVIGTDQLEETVQGLETFFGTSSTQTREDDTLEAQVVSFDDAPVAVAEPLATDSWLADRVESNHTPLPCAFLVDATDVAAVREQFRIAEETAWGDDTVYWFDIDVGGRFGAVDRS